MPADWSMSRVTVGVTFSKPIFQLPQPLAPPLAAASPGANPPDPVGVSMGAPAAPAPEPIVLPPVLEPPPVFEPPAASEPAWPAEPPRSIDWEPGRAAPE